MRPLVILFVVVVCASCSAAPEAPPFAVNVYFAEPPCGAPKSSSALSSLGSVKVIVSGPKSEADATVVVKKSQDFSIGNGNAQGTMKGVPIGSGLSLLVTGRDGNNVNWYGKVPGLNLALGQTLNVSVRLTRMGRLSCVSPPAELTPRSFTGVALMKDGRVFISGGFIASSDAGGGVFTLTATNTAFVFDPRDGSVTATASMAQNRAMHGTIGLKDGRVLVIGGVSQATFKPGAEFPYSTNAQNRVPSLEVYDPKTNKFTKEDFLNVDAFVMPMIAEMADGSIVVAGGGMTPAEAEQIGQNGLTFDPAGGGKILHQGKLLDHFWFGATMIPFGANDAGLTRALIVGGNTSSIYARVYQASSDRQFGLLTDVANASGTVRAFQGAVHLENGVFLLAGGFPVQDSGAAGKTLGAPVGTAELLTVTFDANKKPTGVVAGLTGLTTAVGMVRAHAPQGKNAVLLGGMTGFDGKVSSVVTLFSLKDKAFTPAAELQAQGEEFVARVGHTTALLSDDTVVIVGGMNDARTLFDGVEVYTPSFLDMSK